MYEQQKDAQKHFTAHFSINYENADFEIDIGYKATNIKLAGCGRKQQCSYIKPGARAVFCFL